MEEIEKAYSMFAMHPEYNFFRDFPSLSSLKPIEHAMGSTTTFISDADLISSSLKYN